jgi:hypothetical protein
MAMNWIRCPVLGGHVTRVTDFEGNVTRVICEEYEEPAGTCRLRKTVLRGGPLTQLLERVSEETLNTGGTLCVLRTTSP